MKELKQMMWMVLGVVGGFSIGLGILLQIIQATGDYIPKHPTVALLVSVPILGGGLVGGGYLAQWLVYKYTKAQRKKKQAEKQKGQIGKKKAR